MPLVTFTVTRSAGYENYIDFVSQTGAPSFTMGPNPGTVQQNLSEGTTYTLSGRSDQSSNVSWRQLGNQRVGLEDSPDGDNDYNDLEVSVDIGEFNSVSGNQVTYTASTVSIFTFTASPTSIDSGSPSTLSWTSGGGTTAFINNGVGGVGLNTSTVVYPTTTTTYTLTVTNNAGVSTTAPVTVTVNALPDQQPDSFFIPASEGLTPNQINVVTPDPLGPIPIPILTILGINVPVEITANAPIQISINGGNWLDIRQSP